MMQHKENIVRRYVWFTAGLFLSAFGIALARHSGLGVSPISSIANVISYRFPALSLGTWLIIWNFALILGQLLILRRKFKCIQLLQIPITFLFGWFTDISLQIVSGIPTDTYLVQLVLVICGVVVLAFGVAVAVVADAVLNSGEAFVKAVADLTHAEFGRVKVLFDVSCVVLSVILSLALFDCQVVGTREGTIIAAVLTGFFVSFFTRRIQGPLSAVITRQSAAA